MREPTIPRHVTQEFGRQITQLRVENARLRAVLEGLVRDWLPCRDLSVARWTGSFERCGKCAPCLAASDAAAAVAHSEDVGDGDLFVRTRDAFTGEDLEVTERRQLVGLAKGDLLEARLMPFEGQLWFSGAFLYQPREARARILAEVKRLRKAAGKHGRPDVEGLLATLSRMAFKLERYRNVRLESIYDFSVDARAMTPRPPTRS